MSEQLANLYSTTLASPYTAGDGHITVSSASGAPGSGTFTVAILTGSPLTSLLLYRVTGVSGTTFSGAAEGADVNAPSGATVLGTILSAAAVAQIKTDAGGSGFLQALTAPNHASFSQINYNTGTGVTTTELDGTTPVTFVTIRQVDPSNTQNLAALSKAIIAATFTVTIAVSWAGDPTAGCLAGLWLNDSGSNNLFFGLYQSPNNDGAFLPKIQALTTFHASGSSNVYTPLGNGGLYGPLLWLRIQETVSARNYYFSSDGVTFYLIFTESNSAHFTTANYGFGLIMLNGGAETYDCGVTCYSFAETNP